MTETIKGVLSELRFDIERRRCSVVSLARGATGGRGTELRMKAEGLAIAVEQIDAAIALNDPPATVSVVDILRDDPRRPEGDTMTDPTPDIVIQLRLRDGMRRGTLDCVAADEIETMRADCMTAAALIVNYHDELERLRASKRATVTPAERIAAALEAIELEAGEPASSYLDGYQDVWFGSKWDIAQDHHGDFHLYRKGNWMLSVGSLSLAIAIVADARLIDVGVVTLCPKGERVVVDRTGNIDRLVSQQMVLKFGGGSCVSWVDIDDGPDPFAPKEEA